MNEAEPDRVRQNKAQTVLCLTNLKQIYCTSSIIMEAAIIATMLMSFLAGHLLDSLNL